MTSARWTLNPEQLDSIKRAFIKYAAPLLLIGLTQVQMGKTPQEALPYVYAASITMAINILSKLITETK